MGKEIVTFNHACIASHAMPVTTATTKGTNNHATIPRHITPCKKMDNRGKRTTERYDDENKNIKMFLEFTEAIKHINRKRNKQL